MKPSPSSPALGADAPATEQPRATRRRLVVGAGVAAGAALAAAAVQRNTAAKPEAKSATGETESAQGYRLTDHVRRYYETTRT